MRLDARRQRPHLRKILEVDGIGAADRQRHAVHDQRKALADALQVVQRFAAGNQVVLGDDLEPIDGMRLA